MDGFSIFQTGSLKRACRGECVSQDDWSLQEVDLTAPSKRCGCKVRRHSPRLSRHWVFGCGPAEARGSGGRATTTTTTTTTGEGAEVTCSDKLFETIYTVEFNHILSATRNAESHSETRGNNLAGAGGAPPGRIFKKFFSLKQRILVYFIFLSDGGARCNPPPSRRACLLPSVTDTIARPADISSAPAING